MTFHPRKFWQKLITGVFFLLMIGALHTANAQFFTVSKPIQGSTLNAGDWAETEWSGATAGSYDIYLQVYEDFWWYTVTTLYENQWLASSGSLYWQVPTGLSESSDYRINIQYNWDWTSSYSGTFAIQNSPPATSIFPSSGNTGIETTSPSRPLHVVGDARATGNIRSGDTVAIDTGRRLLTANGSASIPAFMFSAEDGVGMYRAGSSDLRLVTGGGNRLRLTNSYVQSYVRHLFYDGTATSPGLNFASDTNTGLWRPDSNTIGFSTNGTERLRVTPTGNVGIGLSSVNEQLVVDGDIKTKEMIITQQSSDWPDYVFDPDYMLKDLLELGAYVAENRRLPGMPSAGDIDEQGQNLGDVQRLLLEKIEELTLYMISMKREQVQLLEDYEALFWELKRVKGN
ncbi:MAG: hypothetical protein EA391_05410 [Balneolaceae bacterium]|nr:MAG: hypothetical protein EA391_05410 [Balneolaceae bacterium]